MRAVIDAGRCQGHGRCHALAPQVFGEDDEGYGVVLGEADVSAVEPARLARLNCPERAISLHEDR
ncbi:ferredoxin [Amycolatopsis sp. MtRt-6]|uniref:ferredoxin n=1 Tax=Amycolatopsis sp. MtRt-6 TaxID=2792782 RepID=UPI001A9018E2|nr:ferredoxin [Amycolatopsis sp. MtRt-6]